MLPSVVADSPTTSAWRSPTRFPAKGPAPNGSASSEIGGVKKTRGRYLARLVVLRFALPSYMQGNRDFASSGEANLLAQEGSDESLQSAVFCFHAQLFETHLFCFIPAGRSSPPSPAISQFRTKPSDSLLGVPPRRRIPSGALRQRSRTI